LNSDEMWCKRPTITSSLEGVRRTIIGNQVRILNSPAAVLTSKVLCSTTEQPLDELYLRRRNLCVVVYNVELPKCLSRNTCLIFNGLCVLKPLL